jgi:MFS family permease
MHCMSPLTNNVKGSSQSRHTSDLSAEALAAPKSRTIGPGWIAGFALAQFGLWLGLYAPLKVLLPLLADQLASLSGAQKETLLAAATLSGSLVALLANPLAGALSDRSRSRWGPRRPWILAGTLLAGLGIQLLPQARGAVALLGAWCLVKLGLNTSMAALNGAVADQVPARQQGTVWGWVGLAQPIGLVCGVAVSTLLVPQLQQVGALQASLVVLSALPILWWARATRHRTQQHAAPAASRPGLGVLAALRHRAFAQLWWSRCWLYLGWSMSTVFLLYFLEDRLGLPRSQALQAQTLLLALYAGGTVASAAAAGWLSDRTGNRRGFVIAGTSGMALACGLMLISQSLPLALVGSVLLGLAYGVYIATHQALVLEHLPDPQHSARDLGLFNAANTAPMVIAPALAWLCVVHLGGYTTLFAVASLLIAGSLLPLRGLQR